MVGITESPEVLRKWILAGPEVATVISEFETRVFGIAEEQDAVHYSDNPSFIVKFRKDVDELKAAFRAAGNPFQEESSDLFNTETKELASPGVADTVMIIEKSGRDLCEAFVRERLTTTSKQLSDKIPQNKFPLFSTSRKSTKKTKTSEKITNLASDCQLSKSLLIACQGRNGDLDEFFAYENQTNPPALSTMGQARSCKISDLVNCLTSCAEAASANTPFAEAKLFDGAA